MSEEMKGGGWEIDSAGDSDTDAVTWTNTNWDLVNFLMEHGKNGIVLNGVVAWIAIVMERGANELWVSQAVAKFSDEEVNDAKANLWKAATKELGDVQARQGENKKKSDIQDIHKALVLLKGLGKLPLILANSTMIERSPALGGLNEESKVADVVNKVVSLSAVKQG